MARAFRYLHQIGRFTSTTTPRGIADVDVDDPDQQTRSRLDRIQRVRNVGSRRYIYRWRGVRVHFPQLHQRTPVGTFARAVCCSMIWNRILGGRIGVAAIDTGNGARLAHRGDDALCHVLHGSNGCHGRCFLAARSRRQNVSAPHLDRYGLKDLLAHSPVTPQEHVAEGVAADPRSYARPLSRPERQYGRGYTLH